MDKIKLISDSTCDLSQELIKFHNIEIVPLTVSFNDKAYLDSVELTTEEMYMKVDELGLLPKSSAVSPGVFEEVFKKYLIEGYEIIFIGIGSKFSGTFQSAVLAKNLIDTDKVHLIDSENLSSGIGLLLLKASSYRASGDNVENIVSKVTALVPRVRSQFVIDTLEYLYKGGRLSALSALMGKMLNIHPVIQVRNGEMVVGKKAFGSIKKGIQLMINEAVEQKDNIDNEFMMITHSLAPTYPFVAKKVKDNFMIKNVYETHAGCVISTHCGRGTIGILYILK